MSVDRHIDRTVRRLLVERAKATVPLVLHDVHEHDEPLVVIAERIAAEQRRRERRREMLAILDAGQRVGSDGAMHALTKDQRRHLRKRLGLTGKVRTGRPPQTKHGTPGMLRKGCKCDECVGDRNAKQRAYRQRRRGTP